MRKLCADCKHIDGVRRGSSLYVKCSLSMAELVKSSAEEAMDESDCYCNVARKPGKPCGPDGLLFEQYCYSSGRQTMIFYPSKGDDEDPWGTIVKHFRD